MRKLLFAWIATVVAGVASGSVYTVAKDEVLTINDGNRASYSDGITFADASGVVEFETSEAPDMTISGVGTVRKISSASWNLVTSLPNFRGGYRLGGGGVVRMSAADQLGSVTDNDRDNPERGIFVEEGTALIVKGNLRHRCVYIAGSGFGANKALTIDSESTYVPFCSLLGDATVETTDKASAYHFGSSTIATVGGGVNGCISLNGHTLEVTCDTKPWYWRGMTLKDAGSLICRGAGSVTLCDGLRFSTPGQDPIKFYNKGGVTFWNKVNPIPNPVEIHVDNIFGFSAQGGQDSNRPFYSGTWERFDGPVTLGEKESGGWPTVTVSGEDYNHPKYQVTFAGGVQGNGLLKIGRCDTAISSSCPLRGVVDGKGNLFEGGFLVEGGYWAHAHIGWSDFVTDYSAVTVRASHASLMVNVANDADEVRWPKAKVLDFANKAKFASDSVYGNDKAKGFLSLCGQHMNGVPYELTASDVDSVANPDVGWAADYGELRLTGTFEKPLRVGAFSGGVLNLTGAGSVTLSGYSLASNDAPDEPDGEIRIADGMEATLDDGAIVLGCWQNVETVASSSKYPFKPSGRLCVSNALLTVSDISHGTTFTNDSLVVGTYGHGVLEICDDAVVTGRLYVGKHFSSTSRKGQGAVYQRGGAAAWKTAYLGYDSAGTYVLQGGVLDFLSGPQVGYSGGRGLLVVEGGEARYSTNGGTINVGGSANSGYGAVHMRGGSVRLTGTTYTHIAGGNWTEGHVILDGEDAIYETPYLRICHNNHLDGEVRTSTVTLHKGTMYSRGFVQRWNNYDFTNPKTSKFPAVVNFNGGTWKNRNGEGDVFGCEAPNGISFTNVARVAVYEGGICLDTNGRSCNTKSELVGITPSVCGDGKGSVVDIPWTPLGDCVAEPLVIINGDGYGAVAVADFDEKTKTIVSLRVVSPGWGYTQAKATVYRAANVDHVTVDCTIGAPAAPGGLTKSGEGTLSLLAHNTWGQWTKVDGGTLKAGCDRAIPSGTQLTLANGATLDLGNVSDATFSGVAGTGGTVANGTLKIVGEWKISAKKFLDRETTAVAGTIDLTGCTGITLVDTEVLDESTVALKGLDLFAATSVVGLEDVEVSGAPANWRLTKRPDGLRLAPPAKGFMLMICSSSGASARTW